MEETQTRLDQHLANKHPELSRAQLQKFIKSGLVELNGDTCTKSSEKIKSSDKVSLSIPKIIVGNTNIIDIEVLYEDNDCVVINKPIGVLSHSKGAYNAEYTVADWLKTRVRYSFAEANNRSGIVHRLDRATSGVMICAKNQSALKHLQKQFQDRKAKKAYCAVVVGHLQQDHAILDLPIERNPKHPQKFRVGANGKSATTEYIVKQRFEHADLVELRPTTGRTHQLRVHMQYLGHPIYGDNLYHGPKADRMYLHAHSLEITLPNRTRKSFLARLPHEFEGVTK